MRLSHDPLKTHASFDDPNLVSGAGLVPVMALAGRAGLAALVREHVSVTGPCGVNADLKIGCQVAGMAAGADSIEDMDVLRHGAMPELFGGIRAPSTLGSFLRSFTWGSVRQLDAVGRRLLAELAAQAPLLPGGDVLAFIDMDSTQKRVYGHARQGAGLGHAKIQGKALLVRGLNALAAVISTPLASPVIAATRLRGGTANSARGAASLAVEAISAARQAGCTGQLIARIDSACYSAAVLGAIRAAGARFSVTVPMHPKVRAAITAISEDAWTPITCPHAIWDEDQGRLISDAQVAEVPYTAFASRNSKAITARLIVRRVRDLNRKAADGQDELFACWRYHAVLTDSPFEMIQAEAQHRDHAIVEQILADFNDGPLAHLPSGHFPASAAWLTLAAICHNLTRAAGTLAGPVHARARGATVRRQLISVAARIAGMGRPGGWRVPRGQLPGRAAVAQVACVHGIGQAHKGENVLHGEWFPAIADGLRRAGRPDGAFGARDVRCAFYGDVFRPPGRLLGPGDEWLTADDATGYERDLLLAWWQGAADTDPGVIDPAARTLARTPASVQAALRALSGSAFFASIAERAMLADLRQVRRYLREPAVREQAQARVAAAVTADTRVLVGHSLGSVVA